MARFRNHVTGLGKRVTMEGDTNIFIVVIEKIRTVIVVAKVTRLNITSTVGMITTAATESQAVKAHTVASSNKDLSQRTEGLLVSNMDTTAMRITATNITTGRWVRSRQLKSTRDDEAPRKVHSL